MIREDWKIDYCVYAGGARPGMVRIVVRDLFDENKVFDEIQVPRQLYDKRQEELAATGEEYSWFEAARQLYIESESKRT